MPPGGKHLQESAEYIAGHERGVTKAANGEMTMPQGLANQAGQWLTKPLFMLQQRAYHLCLFVYVCTYASANLAEGICNLFLRINPVLPKLVAALLGNMLSCIYKDAQLAIIFG